ncbi:MAG: TonB-dependent receptor plug domain-containing protein [Desulfuromonas sp.]|nr:TonB-dependent receptor plug domain-containing protein [Desulfuromonas sp.]
MNCIVVCLFLLSNILVVRVWASETPLTTDTLPEITVVDSAQVTTAGKSVLDRQTIDVLPQADGAITDLLKVLPGIQFGETSNSALTGGEILPSEISISGGRFYDNNFMIDGMGNNSLLDPTSSNVTDESDVPGHSQGLFLDSSLLESITVQRSNISARYSGFTGGVVEMETRNPAQEFGGQLAYRTTRSEWTSFHVDRDQREDFENSDNYDVQPSFRKQHSNFSLDIPLGEKMGILLAYAKDYSKISLNLLGETGHQYRESENFFVKYRFQPNSKVDFSVTALCTPYTGTYFRKDTLNSKYELDGGGYSLNGEFIYTADIAKITLMGGGVRVKIAVLLQLIFMHGLLLIQPIGVQSSMVKLVWRVDMEILRNLKIILPWLCMASLCRSSY